MNENTERIIHQTVQRAAFTPEFRKLYRLVQGEAGEPNPDIPSVIAGIIREIESSLKSFARVVVETKE